MFLSPWFAIAGLIAAAGPIVIHLLNRRRFRVVEWAAMDFLREAVFRSRRILQLRDLLLLALRTLCILGFGLALARPFLSHEESAVSPDQPVHAVLLVDNSLSMSYQQLSGTILEQAKARAKELIEGLPRGSRISVLPICGSAASFSYDAYYTKEDALEALGAIQPVDRAAKPHETIDLALEACRRVPGMPAKRVVLLTDQQVARWPSDALSEHLDQVPGGIELVELKADELENAWIADFRLRDNVADTQTPAHFVAVLKYDGSAARRDVQVTLSVDGQAIAVQTVDLQPGQQREVEFPPYQFDVATEPGKVSYATAEVSIPHDRLPADDQRFLVVPVVASLPVVFVDQWGQDEEPRHNRYGETFHLRRLLAPLTSQAMRDRQLIQVRHLRIGELDRDALQDARLVVVAGVPGPETTVPLLREYVEQGGNLILAAGAEFDPVQWNESGWLDGLGILPAPLDSVTVGRGPDEGRGSVEAFQLDFNSLKDQSCFALEGIAAEELRDLYALPFFFKMINATLSDEARQAMLARVREDLQQRRRGLEDLRNRLAALSNQEGRGKLADADRRQQAELEQQQARLDPRWLLWAKADQELQDDRAVEEAAARGLPTVLARYTNGLPFMVQRRIGRGEVLLVTTGVYRDWNTLSLCNTMLIFDRILRSMLEQTLPVRNLSTERGMVLPVTAAERTARVTITGPDGKGEPLTIDALGPERFGISVGLRSQRGIYRVTAARTQESAREALEGKLWEVPLAVNGPAEESELVAPAEAELRQRAGQDTGLESAGTVRLAPQQSRLVGTDLWKWVMAAVLGGLVLELVVLAWPFGKA